MEADVQSIMTRVAERMSLSVNELPSNVRGIVESLTNSGSVMAQDTDEVKAEKYAEGAPTDAIIELQGSVGGGGGGGGGYPGCYEISAKNEEKHIESGDLVNCHIICGGICVQGPTGNAWNFANKVLAIRLSSDYSSVILKGYDDFAAIKVDQVSSDVTVYPLYKIGDVKTDEKTGERSGTVEIDYRNIPHFDTWAAMT